MTKPRQPKLRECPFCGKKDATLFNFLLNAQVFCESCEAAGPDKDSGPEAIAAWNRRWKEGI